MKRMLLISLLVLILTLSFVNVVYATPRVLLDGKSIEFDVSPIIEKGRTLVPLRAIFEALGADVSWDDSSNTVTAKKDATEIKLVIGGSAFKNGEPVNIDVPAKLVKGRTLVPLRFVSESMGCQVNWDGVTETVKISSVFDELKQIDINGAYWASDTTLPSWVNLDGDENARFVISIQDWITGQGNEQLVRFYEKANKDIVLKTDGYPDVKAYLYGLTISDGMGKFQGFGVVIEPWELNKMVEGVNYSILPTNANSEYKWFVNSGVYLKIPIETNEDSTKLGNVSGNILNSGIAAIEDDWIYFCNYNGGVLKMKVDGSNVNKITDDDQIRYINVINGWIYYCSFDRIDNQDVHSIYKVKTDGTKKTVLVKVNGRINNVIVAGDWIYYIYQPTEGDAFGGIYKVKINGTCQTKVSDMSAQKFYVDGDWIYADNGKLTKVKIDGSEIQELDTLQPFSLTKSGEWLYYDTVVDWAKQIFGRYKIKIDGTSKQKIEEGGPREFINSTEEWIYFVEGDYKGGSLYKMKADGTNRVLFTDDKCAFINLVGDWIIYENGWGGETRKIRIDGTSKLRLVNSAWK